MGSDIAVFVLTYCLQVPFLCTETVGPASTNFARVLTVCVPYELRDRQLSEVYRRGRHRLVIVNCDLSKII